MLPLLFIFNLAFAAEPTVNVKIEPINPIANEEMQLIVTIEGEGNTSEPDLPDLTDIVVTGSSTSTNISIVNGKTESHRDFIFNIIPKRSGPMVIPPISVTYQGKLLQTTPLRFNVAQTAATNSGPDNQRPYFAKATLSKSKVYLGEQVIYTLKLYYRVNVTDLRLSGPTTEGFWIEEIGEGENRIENVGDNQYRVVTLKKALYPSRSGSLNIGAATLTFYTVKNRRGGGNDIFERLFRDPFFNVGVRELVNVEAPAVGLEVNPLPETGKPKDFSGIVGQVKLNTTLPEQHRLTRGGSFTVTTIVNSTANLKGLESLHWQNAESIKRYDDKPTTQNKVIESGGSTMLSQVRTFKTAIVPLKEGALKLGPIELNYFDPISATYKVASSESFELTVLPAEGNETLVVGEATPNHASNVEQNKLTRLSQDILPNHNLATMRTSQSIKLTGWRLLYLLVLPTLMVLALGGLKQRMTQAQESPRRWQREAFKKALHRLKIVSTEKGDKLADELYAIYNDYLKERLTLAGSVITQEELTLALNRVAPIMKDESLKKAVSELLNQLEAMRLGVVPLRVHEAKDKITEVLNHLERACKKI